MALRKNEKKHLYELVVAHTCSTSTRDFDLNVHVQQYFNDTNSLCEYHI